MTSAVVRNYARALVELMKEANRLDFTGKLAEILIGYLKDRELSLFLRHPKVSPQEKKTLFLKLLPSDTPQEIRNFINLVFDRGRYNLLLQIFETILRLCILEQGYEMVTVISAKPLTDEERGQIIKELESLWEISIYPEFRVNPNILGGIIIRRGDKLYDGSLMGRLNKIKEIFDSQEIVALN